MRDLRQLAEDEDKECTYDAIVTRTALAKVVVLEVVRRLGEAVAIQGVRNARQEERPSAHVADVVQTVDDVERVHGGRLDVVARGRRDAGVITVVEDLAARALCGGPRRRRALVGDDVVAAARSSEQLHHISHEGTHEVFVVVEPPLLCQPFGDAADSAGFCSVSMPSVGSCLLMGTTV